MGLTRLSVNESITRNTRSLHSVVAGEICRDSIYGRRHEETYGNFFSILFQDAANRISVFDHLVVGLIYSPPTS